MRVRELIGSEVLVGYGRERPGRVLDVTDTADLEGIVASANSSFFLIRLESGGLVETSGLNIFFHHPAFIAEDAKTRFP
jgi:hypothetical protein